MAYAQCLWADMGDTDWDYYSWGDDYYPDDYYWGDYYGYWYYTWDYYGGGGENGGGDDGKWERREGASKNALTLLTAAVLAYSAM